LVAKFSVGRATIGCWCRGDGTRGVSTTEIAIEDEASARDHLVAFLDFQLDAGAAVRTIDDD